ncbi:MAG: aromatic ring-hydroxylating dioxygenase subunit alpha [Candidatus Eremiobacteraeota bacterium]|nr:aromatic ring-hydroxylating dioxygenase subunit alpha [Candidatus Eremiobacteraeota bacterium]MBC5826431.1 aromatic ring-hydroxylating dioxygenase subunit alpha [Candidatus Eremiobacteraeota bacterium]
MATFTKASVPLGAKTLPGSYYTSHVTFGQERDRIFAAHWVCIGREEQLGERGDYIVAEVASESIIVVRDDRGQLRAHFNVCRHRGTRICADSRGKFGAAIVCPYHAWTYGLDGRLLAARFMEGTPGFSKSDYALASVALATWNGFVFVNLSPSAQKFEEAFAPVLDRFAAWVIGRLRVGRRIDYDLSCNWKLVVQNYSECYHCPLIHPALERLSSSQSGRNDLLDGAFLGGYMTVRQGGGAMTINGRSARPTLGAVAGEDLDRAYYYALFPTMLLSLHRDYVMAHYLRPLAPDKTQVTCEWLFDPVTMAAPGFDASDAVEFWDMTNRQDWHVCELSQQGIASRAYRPGPYSNQEGLLHAFDRHYLSVMGS